MGFYGNITNTQRSQFQFDKIYNCRAAMEGGMANDGVYIGRFILIEYDKELTNYDFFKAFGDGADGILYADITKTVALMYKENYKKDPEDDIIYGINNGTVVYVDNSSDGRGPYKFYICTGKNDRGAAQFKELDGADLAYRDSSYVFNYQTDMAYARSKGYETGRGWDSTVWQKVFANGAEKYVMVAELNTVVPTFEISADAPSDPPVPPHFDEFSTDVYYKLHMAPSWGLRLASAHPIKGPEIDQKKILEKEIFYSGEDRNYFRSDLFIPLTKTFIDEETGEEAIYYYDEIEKDWSPHDYRYENVTAKLAAESIAYTPNTFYVLKDGEYILDAGVAPDFTQYKYFQRTPRGYYSAIYFNKAGFDSEFSSIDNYTEDKVLMLEGKSGQIYNTHTPGEERVSQNDVKELAIMLPSIGNAVASLWDLMYGGEKNHLSEDEKGRYIRNLEVNWEDANSVQMRKGLRLIKNHKGYFENPDSEDENSYNSAQEIFEYNSNSEAATVAGAINSMHDAIGMIIAEKKGDPYAENAAEGLDMEKIYYYTSENNFFRKKMVYKYNEIEYFYSPIDLNERTYSKGLYYIPLKEDVNVYNNEDFKIAEEENFIIGQQYYAKMSSPENENYSLIPVEEYIPGHYYKTDKNDYIFDVREKPQKDILYYEFHPEYHHLIILNGSYTPNFYYYEKEDHTGYTLATEEEVVEDRKYLSINPLDNDRYTLYPRDASRYEPLKGYRSEVPDENGNYSYNPLTYIYTPGLSSKKTIFYKMEFPSGSDFYNSIPTKIEPLTGEIEPGVQYYTADLEAELNISDSPNWEISFDEYGNIIINQSELRWVMSNPKKVNLLPWEPNKYYYMDENGDYVFLTQEVLKEQLPKMAKRTIIRYDQKKDADGNLLFDENNEPIMEDEPADITTSEPTFVDYYEVHPKQVGVFYVPNKYYFNNSDTQDWVLDRSEKMQSGTDYYVFEEGVFTPSKKIYYEPNKYYYYVEDELVLDTSEEFTEGREYYQKNDFYVLDDLSNVYKPGALWDYALNVIPAPISLATREEAYKLEKMPEFSRGLNTINGLILRINEILEMNDNRTREMNTVQGALNTLQDTIARFNAIGSKTVMVVDDYGRITSANYHTAQPDTITNFKANTVKEVEPEVDRFIKFEVSGNPNEPGIYFEHALAKEVTSEPIITPLGEKYLTIYHPIVDAAGHVVGKQEEQVELIDPELFVVKDEIKDFITDESLTNLATKDEIKDFITDEALTDLVTKDEIKDFVTDAQMEEKYQLKIEDGVYLTEDSTFVFDEENSMTIQSLIDYVKTLEARIAELESPTLEEDSNTPEEEEPTE